MARTDSRFLKAQGELYSLKRYVFEAANSVQTKHLSRASLEACNALNLIIEAMCEAHLEDGQLVVEVSFHRVQTLPGFTLTIDGTLALSYEDDERHVAKGGSGDSNT